MSVDSLVVVCFIISRSMNTISKEILLYHSPIVVPSSPIMHFIEVMICSTTGGDMDVA